jgi:hypothetical protein
MIREKQTMRFNAIHVYGLGTDIIKVFESAFPDREIRTINGKAELAASIGEIEVIFVFRPPRGIWSGAKQLQLIQTIGPGPAFDCSHHQCARGSWYSDERICLGHDVGVR